MGYLQNYASERTVYMTFDDDPVVDMLYTDLVIQYRKAGQLTTTTKTLNPADWVNLGGGMYTLKFSSSEMDTLGNFWFTVVSVRQNNFVYDEFQIDPVPEGTGTTNPPDPEMCVLSGHIKGIDGVVARNIPVSVRPVEFPARYGGNVIAADIINLYTDAYGNFSVQLVRNSIVIITVENAAIRHQITIPDAPTADLLSLLPEFINDYTNP